MWTVHACLLNASILSDSVAPWTVAHWASLSMGFSRQEYWSGLPCPPPGDLPGPWIKPTSPVAPALQADSLQLWPDCLHNWATFPFNLFTVEPPGKSKCKQIEVLNPTSYSCWVSRAKSVTSLYICLLWKWCNIHMYFIGLLFWVRFYTWSAERSTWHKASAQEMLYAVWLKVKVLFAQSCLTLCNPVDCSPPGSSIHGVLQERTLEWAAVPFSRRSWQPRDWTWVSCIEGRFFLWTTKKAYMITIIHRPRCLWAWPVYPRMQK